MKYLCVGETYESNGEKKVGWKRIGEMFSGKSGKQYVKLYHIPGVLIHVYEQTSESKKKETLEDIEF